MSRLCIGLVGVYAYLAFFLLLVAFLPVVGVARLLHGRDPTRRIPGRQVRRLGRACAALMPLWRFTIEGRAPPDIGRGAYVVVANHVSSADPFLLVNLPWDMRWVAKEELFRLPFAGWILRWGGEIPIERGSPLSARAMLQACRETLEAGLSIMIFPEGTRSPNGRLLPFHHGAFELAIRTGAPLLPVVHRGTRACRPKGSLWFGRARARARILEPIPTHGLPLEDVPALRDRIRARMDSALARM